MSTWRAFTGLAGEFAWTDKRGLTWEQARDILRDELGELWSGNCADCAGQAAEALANLDAATPGQPVELTEIDGHDYLILTDQA